MEQKQNKNTTPTIEDLDLRKSALAFAYQILGDKRNQERYASTMYGNPDSGMIYLSDAMNQIAIIHNEYKEQIDKEAPTPCD